MERRRILALLTGAGLAATSVLPGAAAGDEQHRPLLGPTTVSNITSTTANVTGTLDARGRTTGILYSWVAGSASGKSSTYVAGPSFSGPVPATLRGLTPATTYRVHAYAWNSDGDRVGVDTTFSTLAAPVAPAPGAPAPAPAAPGTGPAPAAPAAPTTPAATADDAVIGKTMVVGAEQGTITVQVPGTNRFEVLQQGTAVPVGSVVDATQGTVRLTTAVSATRTQDATLRGARFQVRQARDARGMTDLVLKGGNFAACRATNARAAHAAAKAPRRSLFARDTGGRFRTRGNNSVATVRGTVWTTTDTCAGTTTRVTEGAVSVRDVHTGRTTLVRAGHSYLARPARP
jgi:hypothetical protein